MRIALALALAIGCADGGDGDGDDGPGRVLIIGDPLEGDWFECEYPTNCSATDDDGLRFFTDGTFVDLEGGGIRLGPTDLYCEWSTDAPQTYAWVDGVLTLNRALGNEVFPFTVMGNEATSGENSRWVRADPPRSRGTCPDSTPRDPYLEYFEAVPATVASGQPVTLRWSVAYAGSVNIFQPLGFQITRGPSGEETTQRLTESTRFLLTGFGNDEQVHAEVSVEVIVPPGNEERIVDAGPGVFHVLIENDQLYWSNSGTDPMEGRIVRANLDGTGAVPIAEAEFYPGWLTSDGTYLYWIAREFGMQFDTGTIRRAPLDGGAAETVVGEFRLDSFIDVPEIEDGFVYFAKSTTVGLDLLRAPVDSSGPPEVLVRDLNTINSDFDVDAGVLYYSSSIVFSTYLLALDLATGITSTVATLPEFSIIETGPIVAGSDLVWAQQAESPAVDLFRVPSTGGDPQSVVRIDRYLRRMIADGEWLYWITDSAKVGATRLANGETQTLVTKPDNVYIQDLALTPTHVYYPVDDPQTGGSIERIARP